MDAIGELSPLSPGLIDELVAFMAPVGDGCFQQTEPRRIGGHQLPESPPDSGSENPYSPDTHAISVTQPVLSTDYMLVHDMPVSQMLQQNGDYIYEELKGDEHDVLRNNLSDVVVLPQDPNLVELGLRSVRQDMTLTDITYQNRYNQMRVEMPDLDQGIINPQLVSIHEPLTPVYTNLQEPSIKKRKHSQDVNSQVKCEPAVLSPETLSPQSIPRVAPPSVDSSEAGDDAQFQCIRFSAFQQPGWHTLYDQSLKPVTPPSYVVGADKGFNFSQIDEAYVCQKKNHFQVTCQIQMQGDPHYVKTSEGFKKINAFCLHFYGVKAEDPTQEVKVEQSQSDRTKKPFHPVPVELRREGTKVTVGRLHFAETTNNNMRKKGRPNPDQRHFQLVVALKAHSQVEYMIAAHASDRIIVRASNPGQFESDCTENWWQRGVADNSVHFNGRVGINTDRPDESCVINGNLKVMGHIVHPSDARAKHNIEELDTAQQLKNVQSIRVVKFNYDTSFAEHSGLLGFDPSSPTPSQDTGVIAQEVRRVIPEAVKEAGDVTLPNGDTIQRFLVVNKDRIFMENLGAVKELCKVTGNLENRIDQLEKINKKLCKINILQRRDSARSSGSNDSRYSGLSNSSKSLYNDGNISIEQIRDIARNIRRHECCQKLSHNSPKYTRKQCRSCRENNKKYPNKVKYNKYEEEKHTCNAFSNIQYIDSIESPKTVDENHYSTLSNKNEPWSANNTSRSGNFCGSNLPFCCRKDRIYGDSELISNKFLQIVITVLIFIMAICLVVMSALYFKEHQELLSIKEIRMHEKLSQYAGYGKFSNLNTPPLHRQTQPPDISQNQIQNPKHSSHPTVKKAVKEKGQHKTTTEYVTTPSVVTEGPTSSTPLTTIHASRNYVKRVLHIDPPTSNPAIDEHRILLSRGSEVVGSGCALDNALNAELDVDCQSSCNLDSPQAYDNQEPIERNYQEKDINETSNLTQELKPSIVQPVIPEKNNSESKIDNDSLKNQLRDEISIAESNLLDNNSNKIINSTENETSGRLKRNIALKKLFDKSNVKVTFDRWKRETNDAYLRMSSETDEMILSDQSDELMQMQDCDQVTFGVKSKTFNNESMFEETVCASASYNISYSIPVSKCLKEKHIDMSFKTKKLKQLRLCDLQCKYDSIKNCQLNREIARPIPTDDIWSSKMTLECNMDREMKIRGSFITHKDLCFLTDDKKTPFIEYNIRLFRDCHN